jgi:hypothetical protein
MHFCMFILSSLGKGLATRQSSVQGGLPVNKIPKPGLREALYRSCVSYHAGRSL